MNKSIAEAEVLVVELKRQIKFKNDCIGLTDDLLSADELYVPENYLQAKKEALIKERDILVVELQLAEMIVAVNTGRPGFYLS